nr:MULTISPECIES: LPXTG cell wall anchor domain-containing protein [unclassified Corynebacterium]
MVTYEVKRMCSVCPPQEVGCKSVKICNLEIDKVTSSKDSANNTPSTPGDGGSSNCGGSWLPWIIGGAIIGGLANGSSNGSSNGSAGANQSNQGEQGQQPAKGVRGALANTGVSGVVAALAAALLASAAGALLLVTRRRKES